MSVHLHKQACPSAQPLDGTFSETSDCDGSLKMVCCIGYKLDRKIKGTERWQEKEENG